MTPAADVVIVNISNMPGVSYLAGGSLVAWAKRDGKLAGLRFDIVETDISRPPAALAAEIAARSPRLVGFSCYIWNFAQVMTASRALKALLPGVVVVLGGGQVATTSEKVLRESPWVDFVAYGEGEETFRQLLGSVFLGERPLSGVEGLTLRDGAGVVKTKEPAQVDMRLLDSPYLTGVVAAGRRYAIAIVDDSRGCPFSCKYCDWGPKNMRYSPIEKLEEEFRLLAPHSEMITLTGPDLFMNKKWGIRVVEAFIRATPGANCMLNFSVNPLFLTPDTVTAMAAAPEKFAPSSGLQSIDPEVLRKVNRVFQKERVEANLADLERRAPTMKTSFSLIFGLPGDDLEGFQNTLEWCLRQKVKTFFIHQALVLPGAEFYREAASLGITYQEQPPHNVLSTDKMTRRDLEEARMIGFHTGISLELPGVTEVLRPLADDVTGVPRPYVESIKAWAAYLAEKGVDLTMGQPVSQIDTVYIPDRITKALAKIHETPALLAAIALLTERFAARASREGLRGAPVAPA
jgi:radical SAM superfamily enzyme YgiQ (UPF0313 family)